MRRTLLALLVFLVFACATAGYVARSQTHFDVVNRNWNRATVYASCGQKIRLGVVETGRRKVFSKRLPNCGSVVYLIVDLLAGEARSFGPIHATAGDRVEFAIENNLALSTWSVWE